jgi:hypothetical protein
MSTKAAHTPINEIPEWVRAFNDANYNSSGGRATKITLEVVDNLKAENQELLTSLYNLMSAVETFMSDPKKDDGVHLAIQDAEETLKKHIK